MRVVILADMDMDGLAVKCYVEAFKKQGSAVNATPTLLDEEGRKIDEDMRRKMLLTY